MEYLVYAGSVSNETHQFKGVSRLFCTTKVLLDELSWDNFNESTHLQGQAEAFRKRFGHYPESVHADQIYRTRDNRSWCKARGIRLSGPPLGRPKADPTVQAELKQQARTDERARVAIEGKFGQAKRRFSLARVMAKLAETAQCAIAITLLVLNLERWLRQLLMLLFGLYQVCISALNRLMGRYGPSCDEGDEGDELETGGPWNSEPLWGKTRTTTITALLTA
jgi:hypothetical protein